ncbi:hypothetical protein LRS13_21450 [Svornostia abyssi]|uniref:Uncharacterized protein n=1 Tax=Svornostia abyssi TaxID=2898438 RepID=A0ABY5PEV1_9ACTN|nr:hypothetical protein LRS13_21450 [Parviterribacteraceae bacterium J379]
MRRTTTSLALAAAAALAMTATANAAPSQDFNITAKPAKSSTSSKKFPVTVDFSTGTKDDPGVQPPTTSKAAVFFPAGAVWNGDLFPKCAASSISSAKSTDDCPSGSIVGKGKAAGLAPGPITQNDLTIIAVNGGKDRLNLFVEGTSPLRIQSNLDVKIKKASGDFGLSLNVDIPQNLQEPAPGVPVAITLFQVKVGKTIKVKGKTRGITEVNKCNGTWKAKGVFTYKDGTSATVNDSLKCTKG